MNSNILSIQPVSFWTNNGAKQAVAMEFTGIQYNPAGTAVASFTLNDNTGNVLAASTVFATVEETANWSDDGSFFRLLAQKTGLLPV